MLSGQGGGRRHSVTLPVGHILGHNSHQAAHHGHLDINIEIVGGDDSSKEIEENGSPDQREENVVQSGKGLLSSNGVGTRNTENFEDLSEQAEEVDCKMNGHEVKTNLSVCSANGSFKRNGKAGAVLRPVSPKIDIHVIPPSD